MNPFKPLRTLIIEDEPGAMDKLRSYLVGYCPQITLAGEGDSVETGVKLIHQLKPDLVFLDIMLPDGTAFDLIDRLSSVNFHIIFTTAHDEFAIQAFKYNAIHYLLKPFLPEDILNAVKRIDSLNTTYFDIKSLIPTLRLGGNTSKIVIPSVSKVSYVETSTILHCESDGPYTILYMEECLQLLSTKPLKEYDDLLQPFGFYRIHRSHLINLNKVKEYRKGSVDSVVLNDGTVIEVSRKKRTEFLIAMLQQQ